MVTLSVSGPSNQPFILVRSDTLAPGAVPVGSETLDVDPGSLGVVMNGLAPASFFDLLASTGPTGTATFTLPLDPTISPGSLGAFQAAVFDVSLPNPGIALTAATELFFGPPPCDFGRIAFGAGPGRDALAVSVADGATGLSTPVAGLDGALEVSQFVPASGTRGPGTSGASMPRARRRVPIGSTRTFGSCKPCAGISTTSSTTLPRRSCRG